MKNPRLLPLLVGASLFTGVGLGAVSLPSASAQPAAGAAKMNKKGRAQGARVAKGGVPKRMMAKIEEQMGKPLTEDQKLRLNNAYRARTAAQKAAQDKFAAEAVNVTGLTADQVTQALKRGPAKAKATP